MEKMRNRMNPRGTSGRTSHLLQYAIILCISLLIVSAVIAHGLLLNRQCFDDGAMRLPCAMALDQSGRVYIADPVDNVIRCYSKDGNLACQWGSHGKNDGQFDFPSGIAVNRDGLIYVTDMYNHRVQKFRCDGTFVAKWGAYGRSEGKFSHPYGITVDPEGFVYVADASNYRVQKFSPNGDLLTDWREQSAGEPQPHKTARRACWQNPWNTCD
jgi:DNA-binding beta-propeller fold protein YncE